MDKCRYIDICSKRCKECKAHKMYVRRRITYSICCIVGAISAILLMGFAGSLECNYITVKEFIIMSIMPILLMIGSVELANIVKER